MRFEFDVGPEGDPVPSDIKIVFRQRVAKRVTVSMEYKQCEYVVYSNLPLQRSKRKQEIYIKRNDVLKSGYQTSSDAETCMRLTEGNLSEERRQVAELSSTIERLEEESSNQKHALQAITNERNSLRVNVTSQAQALDNLSAQVATLTWQKNSLTTGLFVSTGVAAVMRLLTTRWSRSVPAIDQNKRQAASKPLLVASLATAAAGFGLGARYASRAEPAPTNDQRLLNSKPLPRLYVAPEYRLPIMAGAVTVALAVLLMTLAVIYDCSSRRRATEHDVFNA
ncbi:unnamed protein product (mitochondrion) [Plasmodiophora brassicae]|uniref:Uncharacterized protein n=1 Tax=Plasmodiophora brassicae TaxID=37360 RepID=A0A3P3Y4N4_PLABS|nr:unnamed protein product [Plasmodiophora brassicae]